jgi:hypothetical protein
MADLDGYEPAGDIDAPFALSAKRHRNQQESESIRAAVHCRTPPLTYEEFRAASPCPGCGRPYIDDERWQSRGTIYFNDEERARYEAEEERYKKAHGDCGSHRHGVSGSLTLHCGKCCPPPPLSPSQIENIREILRNPTPPHELMRWRLRLYCGHVIERRAHYTHKTIHTAFTVRSRSSDDHRRCRDRPCWPTADSDDTSTCVTQAQPLRTRSTSPRTRSRG